MEKDIYRYAKGCLINGLLDIFKVEIDESREIIRHFYDEEGIPSAGEMLEYAEATVSYGTHLEKMLTAELIYENEGQEEEWNIELQEHYKKMNDNDN